MPQAQEKDNTVPFRSKSGEYAVNMHPVQPLVERFVVPLAWATAGFILAKIVSKPQVIRGM
jgi:hypothetical protein